MSAPLSNQQKRYLRGLAHALKPVVLIGAKGITPTLLAELDLALEHHELIKVRVQAGDRDERDQLIATLVEQAGAALVQRTGNVASLYRANPNARRIFLPH